MRVSALTDPDIPFEMGNAQKRLREFLLA